MRSAVSWGVCLLVTLMVGGLVVLALPTASRPVAPLHGLLCTATHCLSYPLPPGWHQEVTTAEEQSTAVLTAPTGRDVLTMTVFASPSVEAAVGALCNPAAPKQRGAGGWFGGIEFRSCQYRQADKRLVSVMVDWMPAGVAIGTYCLVQEQNEDVCHYVRRSYLSWPAQ